MRFCIEGLIGCGKTTLLQHLEKDHGYSVRYEPVEQWEPYLQLFYTDPRRWAFTLQAKVLQTELQDADCHYDIRERSMATTRQVFTRMLADDGLLQQDELALITQLQQGVKHHSVEVVFYLDAPIKVCMERVRARARKSETGDASTLDVHYMVRLQNYHQRFLEGLPSDVRLVVLDGTLPPAELAEVVNTEIQAELGATDLV